MPNMFVDILLPLISSGGILFIVIESLVKRRNKAQEHALSKEDTLLNHIIKQNDDLFASLHAHEQLQDRQIQMVADRLSGIGDSVNALNDRIDQHCRTEAAIDEALVQVLDHQKLNGELAVARELIAQEKAMAKFYENQHKNQRQEA